MSDQGDNNYPVDSTGITMGAGIPAVDLDRLIAATIPVVDLDDPDPAVSRWNELADRDITIIHAGDAERVIPFSRPCWADEAYDVVGSWVGESAYRSRVAHIPLSSSLGLNKEGALDPAYVGVRALVWGSGLHRIRVTKWWADADKSAVAIMLTPTEAVDLAQAVLAAVDMIGDAQ